MKPSQFIETADKSARRDSAQSRNEIRSIDWLSRSPDTLIRVGRPAPSDQQLMAMRAVVARFLARLRQLRLESLRRAVDPQ